MALTLTLPSNGQSGDASTVNTPFGQIATAYNNHTAGLADNHDSVAIGESTSIPESTVVSNAATTSVHARLDMIYVMLSAVMGGSGNATTRYGALATSLNAINTQLTAATASNIPSVLVKRDSNGASAFGQVVSNAYSNAVAALILRPNGAGNQFVFLGYTTFAGSTVGNSMDAVGNAVHLGTLTMGSGPTTVTDSVGKVLSTALNTVGVAQGGTGAVTLTSGAYLKGAGVGAVTTQAVPIPVSDGGTGATTLASGSYVKGNGTGAVSLQAVPIPIADGGTALSSVTAHNLLAGNSGGTAYTTIAPGAANNLLTSNGTDWASSAFTTGLIPVGTLTLDRFSPLWYIPATGGGNALKVTCSAWNGYIAGAYLQFAGGAGLNSPAIDPTGITGSNSRIDLLYLNGSGNLAWAVGIAKLVPLFADVTIPANSVPIVYTKTYASATTITGYIDTGTQAFFLADARNTFGFSAPAAGVAGASTTLTYVTFADETGALANSKRLGNQAIGIFGGSSIWTSAIDPVAFLRNNLAAATYGVSPGFTATTNPLSGNQGAASISTGATDAALSYMMNMAVSPNAQLTPHAALSVSAKIVTVAQFTGLFINNHWCSNLSSALTVDVTAGTPGGGAGLRYVFADTAGASGSNGYGLTVCAATFGAPNTLSPAAPATGRLIAVCHYDGAGTLDSNSVDYANFGIMESTQHRLGALSNVASGGGTGVVTGGTPALCNTYTPLTIKQAKTMSYIMFGGARVICQGGSAARGICVAGIYANPSGFSGQLGVGPIQESQFSTMVVDPTVQYDTTIPVGPAIISAGPGTNTFAPMVWFTGAGGAVFYWAWLTAIPFAP